MDALINRRQVLSGVALSVATLPVAGAVPASGAALVDATQFGCVGDGSTINDAALAAALAALTAQHGGVLRLGTGTFLFSHPIEVPAGSIIEGAGMGVTILRCTADITGVTFSSAHSRCGLQALSLEGTGNKGTGLQIGDHDFTGNHHVRDVIIRNWGTGVRLAGALWTTFDNTIFDANGRGLDFNAGWNSGYSTTIAFRQCVFSANDFGGVTATHTPIMSSNVSWLGCTIERNCHADPGRYPQMAFASGQYGISGFLIDGCYFEAGMKPPPDAIRADGLNCGRISNCTFNDSTYAIRTAGANAASRIVIFGNRFTGSTAQNLHLEQAVEVLAYCNAYGTAGNTLTGPGSGSLTASALHADATDHEWTPELVGSDAPGAHIYCMQSGRYRQLADQVTLHAHVAVSVLDGSVSGTLRVAGLPVPARRSALVSVVNVSASGFLNAPGYTAFQGLIHPGSSCIELVETGSGLVRRPLLAASLRPNTELLLSASYLA
jgi:Pectate lyase superfamily protein